MTDTMSDQHREYVAALAAYTAAQARLIEAKRHYDPKSAPEAIEERKAKQAEYRAQRRAERNTPEAKAAVKAAREEYRAKVRQMSEEYRRRWNAA